MAEMLSFNDVKGRLGVSESTLMNMILFEKFPMQKNNENVYEMSVGDFTEWSNEAAAVKKEPSRRTMIESKFNKPKSARKKSK